MGRDFSSGEMSAGIRSQRLEGVPVVGGMYRAVRWAWAGSNSSNHVWVTWHRARQVIGYGEGSALLPTTANTEAGRSPRSYNRAAVFGAGAAALDLVRKQEGAEGQPAVAYLHEGHTYVGPLPTPFGEVDTSDAENTGTLKAAAMRQGERPLVGGIGLWYQSRGHLYLPPGIEVVADLVPTREMAAQYPGVPMV
jgi:hypothetical protein